MVFHKKQRYKTYDIHFLDLPPKNVDPLFNSSASIGFKLATSSSKFSFSGSGVVMISL